MNSILIESNRVIADSQIVNPKVAADASQTSEIHTLQQDNASWSTTIDSGIELKPGDQISLEACALNLNGAGSGNFQQFNGSVDVPDADGVFRKDNAVEIEVAYYTTNNCEFNFPLPTGKHTVEYNVNLQHDMGAPSFTGRHLWHINFQSFNPTSINTLGTPKPDAQSPNFYIDQAVNINGPANNIQNVGGYFFVGMDTNATEIPGIGAGPTFPAATKPQYCLNKACAAAYINWTSICPFHGLPGVQFGQPIGPLLPLEDSPGYIGANPPIPQTYSSVNLNTDLRNRWYNSGFYQNGFNGNTNPQLIRMGDIYTVPIELCKPLSGTTAVETPQIMQPSSYAEWSDTPASWTAEQVKEVPTFKGSMYNYQPSGRKLYRPRKDKQQYYCRGPFYDFYFNRLFSLTTTPVGDPKMEDMVNLRTYPRNEAYWDFQTQKINVQLQTGNIAPTRIGEIITETFKGKYGDADEPGAEFWQQKTWTPRSEPNRLNQSGEMLEEDVGNISSKSYSTFPTLAGSLMYAANVISPKGAGNDYGWDMITNENIRDYSLLDGNGSAPIGTGNITEGGAYKVNQAKMQYWSNQLCGNPYEWRGVTKILPMIQYRPFCDVTIANDGHWNYQQQSVYTGTAPIAMPNNAFPTLNQRCAANGSTAVNVDVGEFGDLPCLLETPKSGTSTLEDQPYRGLWWITDGTGSSEPTAPSVVSGPFRLQSKPYGMWYPAPPIGGGAVNKYKTLAPDKYDIILTNIVFNGQVSNDIWNDFANDIKGHNETVSGNDTLASQSNEFFDNTFVNWKIGRLDDQKSFPGQYIDQKYSRFKNREGQKGVAQYLPNIYQTNRLFKNNPRDNGYVFNAANRGDINDILSNSSLKTVTAAGGIQGTYTMNPTKMGEYKNDGTYNAQLNPNTLFVDGNPAASPPTNQYAAYQFGPPCWTFFKGEYTENPDEGTGFEKACERTIQGFRYLPTLGDKNGTLYTAENAYAEKIDIGSSISANWTTKPGTLPYEEFKVIWESAAALNGGRGCGWIPIFSKDPTKPKGFSDIPFLGIIYMSHKQKEMPLPEKGEFIMMGTTPSLMQNDLHLPCSTQQNGDLEFKYAFIGMKTPHPTATPPTRPTANDIKLMIASQEASAWATSCYNGTNDPVWVFDNTFNRYTYAKLHTDYFKGNGRFQFGSIGPVTDPDTKEVSILAKPSAFSRQETLPHGYIGLATGTNAIKQKYAELIEGNTCWDYISPGGFKSNTINSVWWGSPEYGTQWELKRMSKPGAQTTNMGPGFANDAVGPRQEYRIDDNNAITSSTVTPYAYIEAAKTPYPTISSQSGISIIGLGIPRTDGSIRTLKNTDFIAFRGTLLDKMGFELGQFLPLFSQVQTQLNHTLYNAYQGPNAPAGKAYRNLCFPISTQAQITTSLTPALCNGFGAERKDIPATSPANLSMPFYNLGMLIPSGATTGNSESMFALSLPSKLNFPYLVCRSNIMTPTNLQYMGGNNGQQLLPAISYLMTNYATNDFFYNTRSDLVFTVNRPYVLTEIRTSIHLPNGTLANTILDENSAVIYRIDFAHRHTNAGDEMKYEEAVQQVFAAVGNTDMPSSVTAVRKTDKK